MGRHSGRDTRALTSSMCFVSSATDSSVVPIAALICVALSNNPSSAAWASDGTVVDAVGAGVARLLVALQPATRAQSPAKATAFRCCITQEYRSQRQGPGVIR